MPVAVNEKNKRCVEMTFFFVSVVVIVKSINKYDKIYIRRC